MVLRKAFLASAILAALWLFGCIALARHFGYPEPAIHDEFAYLLGGDTLLHGRLANAQHPMARFFESPHVFVTPSYASKYPPAQSMFLAAGDKLFGNYYYGVILSGAIAIYLVSAVLTIGAGAVAGLSITALLGLTLLPPMYWAWSYWGGFVAMAGGAALILATQLARRGLLVAAGWTFAAAISVLFLSRPYEGGVLTIAILIVEGRAFYRRKFLLAATPIVLALLIFTAVYDRAVTGDTIGLPHLAHDKRYNAAPNFWMLAPPPDPGMKNPRLAALQGTEGNEFKFYLREHRSPFPLAIVTTLKSFRQSFGWTALLLLLVPFAYRDKPTKRVGLVLVLALAGVALTVFHLPHYGAPLVALIALLIACSAAAALRHRIGSIIAAILFLTAASMSVYNRQSDWKNGARPMALSINRPELIRRLSDMDDDHLVFVHYPSPSWRVDEEWVYNGADIDSQKIVFAHDLGEHENKALLRYYPLRRRWLLTLDDLSLKLTPYPGAP
jgi:hypothetical protein